MSLQIKKINAENEDQWQNFARTHGTLYHDINWAKIIAKTYNWRSAYYLVERNAETVGLLPFMRQGDKVLSLPHLPFSGPIFKCGENQEEGMGLLLRQMEKEQCQFVESRSLGKTFEASSRYITMVVSIGNNQEAVWQGLRTKERNQVRHAQSSGLHVKIGLRYLNDFYNLYSRRMRDFGTPPHSLNWFANILTFLTGANILAVMLNDAVIGAMFFIKYRDTIYISYAATNSKFNHLCPNVYMYWEIFKYACSTDCSSVDLGRTTFTSSNFQFKKHWGGQPIELIYERIDIKTNSRLCLLPVQSDRGKKIMSKIWRNLPYAWHNRLGQIVRRYLP